MSKLETICELITVIKEMLLIQRDNFRPSGQPCVETKEFNLVRNMLVAVFEERYRDAGKFPLFSLAIVFLSSCKLLVGAIYLFILWCYSCFFLLFYLTFFFLVLCIRCY